MLGALPFLKGSVDLLYGQFIFSPYHQDTNQNNAKCQKPTENTSFIPAGSYTDAISPCCRATAGVCSTQHIIAFLVISLLYLELQFE